MTQDDFYRLFTETGEPLYWLLSRAENICGAPSAQDARVPDVKPERPEKA